MLLIELSADPQWNTGDDWKKIAEDGVRAAFSVSPFASLQTVNSVVEVSVRLSNDTEIQDLNNAYRGQDKATNVLSFPQMSKEDLISLSDKPGVELLVGDIIIAKSVCEKEACDKNILLENHVSHLVIHGTLHLLGYDHLEDAEALHMERLEVKALQKLDIANPYLDDSLKR